MDEGRAGKHECYRPSAIVELGNVVYTNCRQISYLVRISIRVSKMCGRRVLNIFFFFLSRKSCWLLLSRSSFFFFSFLFNFYSAEKYLRNFCIVLQKFNIFSPLYITDFNILFFLIFIIFFYRDYFQFWLLNILIDRRNINSVPFFFLLIFVFFYEKEQQFL